MDLLSILLILIVTYFIGKTIEKNHYKRIKKREKALIKKPYVSAGCKTFRPKRPVKSVKLVTGEVVVSGDYFKNFVSKLKQLIGGRLTPFESIMDRARREALLRMRESAPHANIIVNTRIEYCMLNDENQHGQIPKCAVIAYGTAITYEKKPKA